MLFNSKPLDLKILQEQMTQLGVPVAPPGMSEAPVHQEFLGDDIAQIKEGLFELVNYMIENNVIKLAGTLDLGIISRGGLQEWTEGPSNYGHAAGRPIIREKGVYHHNPKEPIWFSNLQGNQWALDFVPYEMKQGWNGPPGNEYKVGEYSVRLIKQMWSYNAREVAGCDFAAAAARARAGLPPCDAARRLNTLLVIDGKTGFPECTAKYNRKTNVDLLSLI